ncbi:MAG TPA: ROK family protein [Phycisphaerae bacterium]|nr:ROK family protein [Phycisphaerae bacterium]
MAQETQQQLWLGWDVGGTKSAAVVGASDGTILDRAEWPSIAANGPDPMIREFLSRARAMLDDHPVVRGAGVSIGGPLNPLTGVILSPPHLPGWDNVALAEILRRELDLPVAVEHDAAACLLAEWLWGAARGCSHAVYLTCGTGCGAGILVANQILRGPDGQTPEAGHIRIAPDGPVMFGKPGSAEAFGSGEGVGRLAHHMFPEAFREPADPKTLVELARSGDERARAVLAESARRTGQFCALLADIFSPQVILLGSLARYFGKDWVGGIENEFRKEALPINSRHTRIVPAALGEKLQDLSAIAPCVHRSLG